MYEPDVEKYFEKLVKEEYAGEKGTTPYCLALPKDAEKRNLPIVLFMHGAGERGCDNDTQLRTAIVPYLESAPNVREAIWIIPQCPVDEQWVATPWTKVCYSVDEVPETWEISNVLKILDSVAAKYGADRDRIYVMGISMGGYATWDLIMRHGELFAAAMPICGGSDPTKAELVKDIPIRTFHGDIDEAVPVDGTRRMVEAVKAAGGTKLEYTEYPGLGHFVWDNAVSTEGIGEWMFSQRLSDRK